MRVLVESCIACGARHRFAACPDGCVDVALDLVEAADVDAVQARLAALDAQNAALRLVVSEFADGTGWNALRSRGHDALALPVPDAQTAPEIIRAWGCQACGRVEASQPCLDVCIYRPVELVDASEWRELAGPIADAERTNRTLSGLVRLIVHVHPRADAAAASRDALQARVAAELAAG